MRIHCYDNLSHNIPFHFEEGSNKNLTFERIMVSYTFFVCDSHRCGAFVRVTLNSEDSRLVGQFLLWVALNSVWCVVSCTHFGEDKMCHKLVSRNLFQKLSTWYWSTNRYACLEIEKKKFLNSRQRTETQNSKHWRNGFRDRGRGRFKCSVRRRC